MRPAQHLAQIEEIEGAFSENMLQSTGTETTERDVERTTVAAARINPHSMHALEVVSIGFWYGPSSIPAPSSKVVRPGATSSFLLLVAMPFAPNTPKNRSPRPSPVFRHTLV